MKDFVFYLLILAFTALNVFYYNQLVLVKAKCSWLQMEVTALTASAHFSSTCNINETTLSLIRAKIDLLENEVGIDPMKARGN